jgi:hypothetical protein
MLVPPSPPGRTAAFNNVGSGTLNNAERQLLVQVSIVFKRIPYTKVEFVPFQIPHAPSFVHNCDKTSMTESDRMRVIETKGGNGLDGVGVEECVLEGTGLRGGR